MAFFGHWREKEAHREHTSILSFCIGAFGCKSPKAHSGWRGKSQTPIGCASGEPGAGCPLAGLGPALLLCSLRSSAFALTGKPSPLGQLRAQQQERCPSPCLLPVWDRPVHPSVSVAAENTLIGQTWLRASPSELGHWHQPPGNPGD